MSAANSNVLDSMVLGEVNAKGFIDDSVRDEFFKKLRVQQDNRTCFDCSNRNPTWISLSHGTFVCLECSGEHRRKGVHISFVRSADMDSFTPEQIAKMSVGGNGKAREYFKGHGMGRTSETGKPVDYNSKAALRYRQMIEKDAQEACKKLGCVCKPSPAAAEPEAQSTPATDDFFSLEGLGTGQSKAAAPPAQSKLSMPQAAAAAPPSIPKAESTPSVNVVVRRPEAEPSFASIKTNSAPVLGPGAKQGAKPKAIDFDFDFDELEKEANLPPPPKPEPAPVAKVAAPAAQPKPVQPSIPQPAMGGYPKAAAPTANFANRKSFGSDDFFSEFESSADRQNQYNRFAGQGAISSDAFFGREEQAPEKGTLTSLLSAVSSAGSELLASAKGSDTYQSGTPMFDGISSYIGRRMNN